jgi:demethylmenaquinone methyltransferase / 2-methoxy-6-polyprenyl-1,4-benzoquinol methylase
MAMAEQRPTTDFGFERVPLAEKARRVRGVFDSVAEHYDLMNDLMSAGTHRLWKRFTLALANLRPGQRALDVAAGSGDLAAGLARQVGARGLVVLSDINAAMLARGRDRLIDEGIVGNVAFVQADAERLPFSDGTFDCITIGFGLRNVTDKPAALAAMRRALKPGGQLLVLEFSQPRLPGDDASYRYLAESIRMHPDADTLLKMLQEAGLEGCRYHSLAGGIVAVHRGYRA